MSKPKIYCYQCHNSVYFRYTTFGLCLYCLAKRRILFDPKHTIGMCHLVEPEDVLKLRNGVWKARAVSDIPWVNEKFTPSE